MKLEESSSDQLMSIAAIRYCLGRRYYIVSVLSLYSKTVKEVFDSEYTAIDEF